MNNMKKLIKLKAILLASIVFTVFSCNQSNKKGGTKTGEKTSTEEVSATRTDGFSETKNAYFGNLHIHTSWSFDGYTNGSVTNPDDAYRWALGEAIPGGGGGGDMQIKAPLDWYAVSDHAEYMGVFKNMENPNSPLSKLDIPKADKKD
jgi:hypothetical protein